jgi:hypothetical protein
MRYKDGLQALPKQILSLMNILSSTHEQVVIKAWTSSHQGLDKLFTRLKIGNHALQKYFLATVLFAHKKSPAEPGFI